VRPRTRLWRLPVWLAVLSLLIAAQPVSAQVLPESPATLPGFGELVTNPGNWLTSMFNVALVNLGKKTTGDVVDFMSWLLGSGNVISQTPAGLSYDSQAVKSLWEPMKVVADAGLAVVTVWGGVNMMRRATSTLGFHSDPAGGDAKISWLPAKWSRSHRLSQRRFHLTDSTSIPRAVPICDGFSPARSSSRWSTACSGRRLSIFSLHAESRPLTGSHRAEEVRRAHPSLSAALPTLYSSRRSDDQD
jgi:hypothetical protein